MNLVEKKKTNELEAEELAGAREENCARVGVGVGVGERGRRKGRSRRKGGKGRKVPL